jgi:hypothetical protein
MAAFREPKLIECASSGDNRRWLWVMEPTLGRIFGKALIISRHDEVLHGPKWVEGQKQDAYNEMLSRCGNDKFLVPEGSLWEAFL